jgi:hypothetical protein
MAWHGMRGWFGWLACLLAHDDATAVVASLDMLRYPREEQQQACVCVCRSVCVYWGSGCVVIGLARDAPGTLRVLSWTYRVPNWHCGPSGVSRHWMVVCRMVHCIALHVLNRTGHTQIAMRIAGRVASTASCQA